jgi:hypothetical protein
MSSAAALSGCAECHPDCLAQRRKAATFMRFLATFAPLRELR